MKPKKLLAIECPECYRMKYGEKVTVDHLVNGHNWTRESATRFVKFKKENS